MSGISVRVREQAPGPLPKPLPGYDHVNRYWDHQNHCFAAKILPGEYYVTIRGEMITTVLGSCVSACIRDKKLGLGGMNHFMLPHSDQLTSWDMSSQAARYGSYAMEVLINDILKNGGRRENLEVKLFGGGRVLNINSNVGNKNIDFVREYIHAEGLTTLVEDLGDIYPRKVIYFPDSGRARVKKLRTMHNDTILTREKSYITNLEIEEPRIENNAIELF